MQPKRISSPLQLLQAWLLHKNGKLNVLYHQNMIPEEKWATLEYQQKKTTAIF